MIGNAIYVGTLILREEINAIAAKKIRANASLACLKENRGMLHKWKSEMSMASSSEPSIINQIKQTEYQLLNFILMA
jgi:hypothetical protein